MLAVVAAVGFAGGAWFGGPLVTPLIARVATSGAGSGHGEESGVHGAEAPPSDTPLLVADLVVNPARSGGTRFLVAAVSLVGEQRALAALSARDAEMRDRLLTLLAGRTVDELSDVTGRETIREELRAALNSLLGYEGIRRIFFTQFLIQ
jgi:flagellar FliL protein